MAVERDEVAMVRAALAEYLALARRGFTKEGVLGYPVATILFAFIDAIGSYHCGVTAFKVRVDNKDVGIAETKHHLRIMNSDYFGLSLTGEQINRLYKLTRSPLTHNGLIGLGTVLLPGEAGGRAIEETNGLLNVRLAELLSLCEKAYEKFDANAHNIVPNSMAAEELRLKEAAWGPQIRKAMAQLASQETPPAASAMGGRAHDAPFVDKDPA